MIRIAKLADRFNLQMEKGEDIIIKSLGSVESEREHMLTYAESEDYFRKAVDNPFVTAIITKQEFAQAKRGKTLLLCDNPRYSFFTVHNYLAKETDFYGEIEKSKVSSSAKIHHTAFVSERGVLIGDNVAIGPNVTILEHTHIEQNAIVQAGAVIGSEGFEYKRFGDKVLSVIHAGGVHIEQGVEIGANTCVDKAIFGGYTRIGQNTKIDNLVHIAHACDIGKRCYIIALSLLGGSVIIEDDVFIGPASSIRPGVRIGRNATVSIGSVVIKDVPPKARVTGNFAIEHDKFLAFIKSIQ